MIATRLALGIGMATLVGCASAAAPKPVLPAAEWTCAADATRLESVASDINGCYSPAEPGWLVFLRFASKFIPSPSHEGDASWPTREDDETCVQAYLAQGCGGEQLWLCRDDGSCTAMGRRRVVAANDEQCRASTRCASWGECTFVGAGRCAAHDDRDCAAASEACAVFGRCAAGDEGRCVAASDEGCRASTGCHERGSCSAQSEGCWALSDDDCLDTTGCAERGRCAAHEGVCTSPEGR